MMFQKKMILRGEEISHRIFDAINLLKTHTRNSDNHYKYEKGNKYRKHFEFLHILWT